MHRLNILQLIKKRVILQDKGDEGFDRVFGYGLVDFEKVSLIASYHQEI